MGRCRVTIRLVAMTAIREWVGKEQEKGHKQNSLNVSGRTGFLEVFDFLTVNL